MHRAIGISVLLMMAAASLAVAQEPAQRACRSVHLWYSAPAGTAFFNQVTVEKSAAGSYFMACGFNHGYFGIQELGNGKKIVLFSVWDPGRQNDPRSVAADRQVKVIAQGEGVRIKRFGGEGTGAQCQYDFDWKIGQTCQFLIEAKKDGEHTAYAAYFRPADQKEWKHLATFETLSGKNLAGYYSFVEDFRRNRVSATQVHRARFGSGWIREENGQWIGLTQARFTGDSNPAMNIDAGANGGSFFLATGGDTKNDHTKLKQMIACDPSPMPNLSR